MNKRRRYYRRVPLAWLQLTRNKVKLLVALMGITFAVMLVFMQLAFLDSLYISQTALHKLLNTDLVLINPQMKTLANTIEFPRQYLYRLLNIDGVKSVNYIYHSQEVLNYGKTQGGKGVILLGINPYDLPFDFSVDSSLIHRLNTPGVILFDRKSDLKEYGTIVNDLQRSDSVTAELNSRKVHIAGLIDFAGASFADDGNVIASNSTFLSLKNNHSADDITLGLVTLQDNIDAPTILPKLQSLLPDSLEVMTKEDFIEHEKLYWSTSAPIGFVFSMGIFVGYVVGVIVVYQILYTEVSEHLSDYAVLKARGFRHRYFVRVLFQQAIILGVLGYIPGYAISVILYEFTSAMTSLPIYMTLARGLMVYGLTNMMCFTSGLISMRKLEQADPSELF